MEGAHTPVHGAEDAVRAASCDHAGGRDVRVRLRHADRSDLETLVALHGAGFVGAHRGVLHDSYLLRRRLTTGESFREEWASALSSSGSGSGGRATGASTGRSDGGRAASAPHLARTTLVLESVGAAGAGTVLGFVAVEPAGRHARRAAPSAATQLRKLYLSDAAPRRRGLGSLLLRAGLLAAAELGGGGRICTAQLDELCASHEARRGGAVGRRRAVASASATEEGAAARRDDGDGEVDGHERVGMSVWCLAGNSSACAFYAACGMRRVADAHKARFGGRSYDYSGFVVDDARAASEAL
uniref:Uncharacterized protein n=1 Tax=Bicosoecida sp. CB-2014 TaxID=1486930 RepID=A0A7S1CGH9_9STRA|mmetsp:Transcript_24196/g.84024  ORF Transcript_24196/g.84024 Transcript_24196/m.84024 type:complete len:300 (+) Transcript_24196:97-996(+)